MKKLISLIVIFIFSSSVGLAQTGADKPQVTIHTSKGDIRLELYPQEAPISVENFLQYARDVEPYRYHHSGSSLASHAATWYRK